MCESAAFYLSGCSIEVDEVMLEKEEIREDIK
jgi:hypothetical protein